MCRRLFSAVLINMQIGYRPCGHYSKRRRVRGCERDYGSAVHGAIHAWHHVAGIQPKLISTSAPTQSCASTYSKQDDLTCFPVLTGSLSKVGTQPHGT
jgi:hypothetical protein